jgi:hypothetical protein
MTVNDANNVIQSRDITVWQKAYASAPALPANTVVAGAAWSGYTKAGWTDGGAGFSIAQTFNDVGVDQVPDPLYEIFASRTIQLTAALAEISPANIKLAGGAGTVTVTLGDPTTLGQDELVLGTGITPDINTWGLDIAQPINGLPYRVLVPRGQSTGGVTSTVSPTQKGLANVQVRALPDTTFTPTRILVVRQVTPIIPA